MDGISVGFLADMFAGGIAPGVAIGLLCLILAYVWEAIGKKE